MSRYSGLFGDDDKSDAGAVQTPASSPRYSLLLVDDEENVLKALQRIFRHENYHVHIAGNADAALKRLAQQPVQVVISDFKMPGMNGAELLKRIKADWPDTIRIMMTGHADTTAVMGAVNEGAVYKFILKPWNDDDLRITVALALEQYDLVLRNRALRQENAKKTKEIGALAKLAVSNRSQLAIMLHKRGLLNDKQAQELHKLQQHRKEPMLRVLLEKQWIAESQIRELLRRDLLVEEVALAEYTVDAGVAALIPGNLCKKQWIVPLRLDGRRLLLAVADPMDSGIVDDIRFASGLDIQTVMADVGAIEEKINEIYGADAMALADYSSFVTHADPIEGIEIVIEEDDITPLEDLLRSTEEPPAIRLANAIMLEALRLGASDIHIQPRTKSVVVRYRIDGVLTDKIQIPLHLYPALVSRIKVMAELDISERRRPQDGRITVRTSMKIVDLRISTLPTISGEKVVMRVLDRHGAIKRAEELGFSSRTLPKVLTMVSRPQGIILTTGPTGSGKTTTLYSLLQQNATPAKNYVTIEDPVEFFMEAAGQVYVREKVGLNFASVLRAILRQDPDVILLGEIRDKDTAEVAFHAALTGHMVFSTLHANSCAASIARLFDLGLAPYTIASALEGVIAQRLVRRICAGCKAQVATEAGALAKLGPRFTRDKLPHGFVGAGCERCHGTGYRGRVALYEVMMLDETLRALIGGGAGSAELLAAFVAGGGETLLDDAFLKVSQGDTTADEILRVLGAQVVT